MIGRSWRLSARSAGLVVLDFTQLLPGPYCTRLLADLGARVVKVEPPWGEGLRTRPPLLPSGESAGYTALNRGKETVTLDLRSPEGRADAVELARSCDALIEGFRPGVMDRLGLGFAAVKAINPTVVYCSLTGYGQDGPYAQRAGHDVNYLGLTGALGLGGAPDGAPLLPAVQVADIGGGSLMAALSIVAALLGRQRGTLDGGRLPGRQHGGRRGVVAGAHGRVGVRGWPDARPRGRPPQRRRAVLRYLRDGGRPVHGARRAGAEVLGDVLHGRRAAGVGRAPARGARPTVSPPTCARCSPAAPRPSGSRRSARRTPAARRSWTGTRSGPIRTSRRAGS